jgi:hypothetical protein
MAVNFVDLNNQNPACLFWVAKIQECGKIRPFPSKAGDGNQSKKPLAHK